MKELNEAQTLTNVHLSDAQKLVMTKIKASANANVALEQTRNNTNLATAQKVLIKLGLLQLDDSGISLTDKGIKVMSDENLTDESGDLTEEGHKYAGATDLNALAKTIKQEPSSEPVKPNIDNDSTQSDTTLGENNTLFRDVNALANIKLLNR